MSEGFYKRRRGVVEHIENGTIDLLENGIHDYLSLKANLVIGAHSSIPAGVVFTSAPALHPYYRSVSERTIQRCLEHLHRIGWIKSFHVPCQKGNYPVLICRASVADLSGNEYRVNGLKTTDWQRPFYEPVGQVSGKCRLLENRELRRKERGGEMRKKKAAATRPADARHVEFFKFAWGTYKDRFNGQAPAWGSLRGEADGRLRNFLRLHPHLSIEVLKTCWTNFLASTRSYHANTHGDLFHFFAHVDEFRDGPRLAVERKGFTNGKPDVNDNLATTLAAFRAVEQAKSVN